MKPFCLLAVSIALLFSAPALAQSQADFVKAFSGDWQTYDRAMATGSGFCQLDLSSKARDSRMAATAKDCAVPLASTASWAIEGSQLALYDGDGKVLVKLGGNQKRITGTAGAGMPIVLERAGGDGTATALMAAYNASGCYYLGYSQKCANKAELAEPTPAPSGGIHVHVEVNLNVHSEPRGDASTVGRVPAGSCVAVETCVVASDGPWCRAKFGDETGWLRKFTLRQNRWPVVTYTNSCG